jgi:hypothetical protein
MLRANLSTRPFYNVRAVRVALGLAALVVAAAAVFNAGQFLALRDSEAALSSRATEALGQADRLRAEARAIRAQVDPLELERVTAAARDANGVIEQRAFSWTEFLTHVESALPNDVRVTSVQPSVAGREVQVVMTVETRRSSDLGDFMDALEAENAFRNVLPAKIDEADDGLIDVVIEGIYTPMARTASSWTATGATASGDGDEP